jgi:hypothetical protein
MRRQWAAQIRIGEGIDELCRYARALGDWT